MTIIDLPPDCISEIISFLDNMKDFFSIQRSNKIFQEIFSSKNFFGSKNIIFKNKRIESEEEYKESQPKFLSGISFIRTIFLDIKNFDFFSDMYGSNITTKMIRSWSTKFNNLENVSIRIKTIDVENTVLWSTFKGSFLNKVKSLEIQKNYADLKNNAISSFTYFKNLTQLKIKKIDLADFEDFNYKEGMFQGFKNLKDLRIYTGPFYSKTLTTLETDLTPFKNLPKLEYLEFSSDNFFDVKIVLYFLKNHKIPKINIRSGNYPVVCTKINFNEFKTIKTDTKLSMCCKNFFSPEEFTTKGYVFYDECDDSQVNSIRCKQCRKCPICKYESEPLLYSNTNMYDGRDRSVFYCSRHYCQHQRNMMMW